MAKRLDDGLFRLIQQMTRSEKRHFTLNFGQDKKVPVYYQIFEVIKDMEEYEPEKLKEAFPKNLSRNKSILFEKILHSMRDYEREKNERMQMKEKLIDAKYLLERGLNELGEERLEEAKKLAIKFGDYLALLDINMHERALLKVTNDESVNHKEVVNQRIEESKTYLEKLSIEMECLKDYDILFECHKTDNSVNDAILYDLYKEKFPNQVPEDLPDEYGILAKRRYLQSGALWHHMAGDKDAEDQYCNKILDWWDTQEQMRKEADYWYVADLSNFVQAYFRRSDHTGIEKVFELISGVETTNQHTKRLIFHALTVNRFNTFILSNEVKDAKEMVPQIKKGLKEFALNPATKLTIFYNVLMLYFILWDIRNLRMWNDKILDMFPNSYRTDIQHFALLLETMMDFEKGVLLKDIYSFNRAHKHFYRKLKLKKEDFEKVVLKFLSQTASVPKGDREKSYEKFLGQLKQIKASIPEGRPRIGLDALMLWAQSKMQGRDMVTIIKEN